MIPPKPEEFQNFFTAASFTVVHAAAVLVLAHV
jgi:hypothetical protein